MSEEHADDHRTSPRSGFHRAERHAADERDETIERLDLSLAEERENAAALRKSVQDLRFQMQVLEKSYAKQLADARERCAETERDLTDQKAAFAVLENECQQALQLLTQARTQLERLTGNRGGPRTRSAAHDGRTREAPQERFASRQGEGTINELIADSSWVEAARAAVDRDEAHRNAQVPVAGHEPLAGDMIAPDVVFPDGTEDEEAASDGA